MLDPPFPSLGGMDKLTSLFPPVTANSTTTTASLESSAVNRPNLLFGGGQSLFDSSVSDGSLLDWSSSSLPALSDTSINDDLLSLSLLATLSPPGLHTTSDLLLPSQQSQLAQLQMAALAAASRYNSALGAAQAQAQSRRSSTASFGQLHSPATAPSTPSMGGNTKLNSSSCPSPGTFGHAPKNPKLYKTELCRSWMDHGRCNYGERCQYAHGEHEKRPIPRHPKYKTEACQSFHQTGYCPYGPRCHFIHSESELMAAQMQRQAQATAASNKQQVLKMDPPSSLGSLPQLASSPLSPISSLSGLSNTVPSTPTRLPAYCGSLGDSPASSSSSADSGSESPIGSFSPSLDIDDTPLGLLTSVYPPPHVSQQQHQQQQKKESIEEGIKMDGLMHDIVAWTISEPKVPQPSSSAVSSSSPPPRLPVFASLSNASSQ